MARPKKATQPDQIVPEGEAPIIKDEINKSLVTTNTYVATQEDLFQQALAEVEDTIVTMFSHGASLSAIHKRFPTYPPAQVASLIEQRLTLSSSVLALYPGMQVHGFNDDLRQLSLLIEDKHSEMKDKLKALELRTKTRQALIDYLQDQGILNKPVSEGGVSENPLYGDQKPSSIVITFDNLKTPEERTRYIECLKNGEVYEPV